MLCSTITPPPRPSFDLGLVCIRSTYLQPASRSCESARCSVESRSRRCRPRDHARDNEWRTPGSASRQPSVLLHPFRRAGSMSTWRGCSTMTFFFQVAVSLLDRAGIAAGYCVGRLYWSSSLFAGSWWRRCLIPPLAGLFVHSPSPDCLAGLTRNPWRARHSARQTRLEPGSIPDDMPTPSA